MTLPSYIKKENVSGVKCYFNTRNGRYISYDSRSKKWLLHSLHDKEIFKVKILKTALHWLKGLDRVDKYTGEELD